MIWYQIFALNPGVSLDLQGSMAIPYGPAISLLHLELLPSPAGTRLTVSEATIGTSADRKAKSEGWQRVFGGGLKNHVEAVR